MNLLLHTTSGIVAAIHEYVPIESGMCTIRRQRWHSWGQTRICHAGGWCRMLSQPADTSVQFWRSHWLAWLANQKYCPLIVNTVPLPFFWGNAAWTVSFGTSFVARRVLHSLLHVLPALRLRQQQQGWAEHGSSHLRVHVSEHEPPHLSTRAGMSTVFTSSGQKNIASNWW